jgi:hypothetical protein
MDIGKLWAGKLFGTNTGNIFVELQPTEGRFSGVLRVADDRFGVAVYDISGSFQAGAIDFTGKAATAPSDTVHGDISAKGTMTAEGHLRGQWTSSIGTGGTFVLFPHDTSESASKSDLLVPEQLHTASRTAGALRLYAQDIQELSELLSRDFPQGRVVLTYRERGHEVSAYASDIQGQFGRLGQLRYLKLYIQAPDVNGLTKFAYVEMNADGLNEVRVQGAQESWVIGKAETIALFLKSHQKPLATTFRSFGLNINGLLAIATLVAMPELPLPRRSVFVTAMAIIGWSILKAHTRFIPNFIAYLVPHPPGLLERTWPQAISWLIAATSALIASIIYGILKGEYSPGWLIWLLN